VYVMSLLFLLASVVSLLMGLRPGGLALVFVSICSSLLAALFLAASVLRKRSDGWVEEEEAGSRVDEWRGTAGTGRTEVREGSYAAKDPVDSLAREPLVGIIDRPIAARHGADLDIPLGPAPGESEGGVLGPDVIVAADRHTYHLPGCEHARGKRSGDRMKRAVAKRLGFMACGVCRPG
jgi:hypothetical protein